jgi:uncharacterized protein YbjT (DUF2867 family)
MVSMDGVGSSLRDARVLVLGGTGHIGQAVVREMLRCGATVTATSRRTKGEALLGLGAEVAFGDLDGPGQVDAWLEGQDVVVEQAFRPLHEERP